MNSKSFWGWSSTEALREGGESGGFVTSFLESIVGKYDNILAVRKTGTVFEGAVMSIDSKEDAIKTQGALHAVCMELSHYIKKGERTAIVLKPCDARAVIENMKRNHVERENVLLIGLNCGGTLPPVDTMRFIDNYFELAPEDIVKEEIAKGKIIFKTTSGKEFWKTIDEIEEEGFGRRENCRYCDVKIPSMCDIACGNWGTPAGKNITFVEVFTENGNNALEQAVREGFINVGEPSEKMIAVRSKINGIMKKMAGGWNKRIIGRLRNMPNEERLAYIKNVLSPCIACYACRKACPVCKCGDDCKCMQMDPDDSLPISIFHSIRLLHLTESCIGCGNCSDVCPVDIPLAHLHQLFARNYEKKTGYKPGMSIEDIPPLSRGDLPEGY